MGSEKYEKSFFLIIAIAIAGGIIGLVNGMASDKKMNPDKVELGNLTISAWIPEWQSKLSMENIKDSAGGLENLHVFGAYFNEYDKPFLTDGAVKIYEDAKKNFDNTHTILLTVINDLVITGKPSVQKDSTLLHRFVKDEESRKKHIADLLVLVEQYDVDGLEIDYEKIAKEDTKNYILFLEELYAALKDKGLSMHVVLVPSFPFEELLPSGPKYTVMAYNVHGFHSGPGAKATYKFLDQLFVKLKKSNQHFGIAFATGGFTWETNGKTKALTEIEAEALLASTKATPQRDEESDAIYFTYPENGIQKEAWYADQVTLENWINYVRKHAPEYTDFILWRVGGLGNETVKWISTVQNN